jgi:WD40 repeat protein
MSEEIDQLLNRRQG